MRTLLQFVLMALLSTTVLAQWANVPAPQIPRTPDGKPNLSAPAPRLPDGTPDLSGVWSPPTGFSRDLARELARRFEGGWAICRPWKEPAA